MSPKDSVERIVIAIRPDGRAIAVYSDSVAFEALGRITAMPRASRVEWDAVVQEWVARDARTGDIVAHSRSRESVLRDEHAHYVDVIARGDGAVRPLAVPYLDLSEESDPRARTRVQCTGRVRPTATARVGRDGSRAICEVASESAPDVWYTVYEQRGGALFCTCPDFVYHRRRRGEECKHLRGLRVQGLLQTTTTAAAKRSVGDLSLPRFLILDLSEVPNATRGDHGHDHAPRPRHRHRQGNWRTAL